MTGGCLGAWPAPALCIRVDCLEAAALTDIHEFCAGLCAALYINDLQLWDVLPCVLCH